MCFSFVPFVNSFLNAHSHGVCFLISVTADEKNYIHYNKVKKLVGALRQVNRKRLCQGWKQSSVLPPSHPFCKSPHHNTPFPKLQLSIKYFWKKLTQQDTSIFLGETKLYPQFQNASPQKKQQQQQQNNNNTCFGAYLYSMGTQLGNLHQLSVTMNRVTCFIYSAAHTGTSVSQRQCRKSLWEVLEKMHVNGAEG